MSEEENTKGLKDIAEDAHSNDAGRMPSSEEGREEKKESFIWESVLHIEDGNGRNDEEDRKKKKERRRAFIVTSEDGASSVEEIGRNQEVVIISGEEDGRKRRREMMEHVISSRGAERMSVIAMEEPAELIQAISKVLRYGCDGTYRDSLAEEMADVRIILGELSIMYGIGDEEIEHIMERKLQREMTRIAAERRNSGENRNR